LEPSLLPVKTDKEDWIMQVLKNNFCCDRHAVKTVLGDESGEGREDAIFCGGERIGFMRAAFGVYEEVEGKVVRVNPLCADGEVRNKEEVRGSIAMVLRGSSSDVPCSFVDKARRVGEAGAIGMIVVNDEDSLISPGDSRREGGDVAFPVVGIKLMDAEKMEDKSTVRITFKETDQFSPAQRRFLRAVAIFRDKQGDLTRIVIPKSAKTENVLEEIEEELARRELVIAKMEQKEEEMKKVTLDDIEDIIDVASVIADNLGASIVHVSCSSILLYRPAPGIQDAIIIPEDDDFELPVELAELTDMSRVIQLKDDEEEEEQEEQEIKGMGP